MKRGNKQTQREVATSNGGVSNSTPSIGLGTLLLPLGFKPNESILNGLSKLLDDCTEDSGLASPIDVIKQRLQLDKLNVEEQLPAIMAAISGESSDLPKPLQEIIASLTNVLFSTLTVDGKLLPAKRPSMSDIIRLVALLKKWKGRVSRGDHAAQRVRDSYSDRQNGFDSFDNNDFSIFN